MDSNKARADIDKAFKAKQILESPILLEAVENYRKDIFDFIANSDPKDKEGRESAYYELFVLKGILQKLHSAVDNGKIAEKTTEQRD